jgi:hypothetical protein
MELYPAIASTSPQKFALLSNLVDDGSMGNPKIDLLQMSILNSESVQMNLAIRVGIFGRAL